MCEIIKKISFEEIKWYLTLSFWILVFLAIFFYFTYLEENYEIIKYLNIFIIINIPLYYFIYNYREKAKKKKLEKSIIIKNIDFQYYRDIIEGYSPAMLSFILDGIEVDNISYK